MTKGKVSSSATAGASPAQLPSHLTSPPSAARHDLASFGLHPATGFARRWSSAEAYARSLDTRRSVDRSTPIGEALGSQAPMADAVETYRVASEANDLDGMMDTLAPDAELMSPISGRMVFRGRDDLRVLLGTVYSTIRDLRWGEPMGQGDAWVLIGDCRIGPLRLSDAMAFDLAGDGRIRRIRPHLRPWLATTLFALMLGPQLVRHPGVILRALRRA